MLPTHPFPSIPVSAAVSPTSASMDQSSIDSLPLPNSSSPPPHRGEVKGSSIGLPFLYCVGCCIMVSCGHCPSPVVGCLFAPFMLCAKVCCPEAENYH